MITDNEIINQLCKRINDRLDGKHKIEVREYPYQIRIDGLTEFTFDYTEDVISCLQGFETGIQMLHRVAYA